MPHGLHGKTLGLRIAKALGLNPDGLESITLHCPCDGPAIVVVQRLVPGGPQGGEVISSFADFTVVPVEEGTSGA